MSKINAVIPKDNYILEIRFDNGSSILLNFYNRLETIRFCPLADPNFFKTAITDGNCIRWGHSIEVSILEAFQLAQK